MLSITLSLPFFGRQQPNTLDYPLYRQNPNDSIISVRIDTVKPSTDTIAIDTTAQKKNALEAIVNYSAKDSIVMTAGNWGYLYGDGNVKYTAIELKAERIAMSMDSNIVTATFAIDSVGEEFGHPIFTDNGTDYESKSMKYNFKTKKGYITDVITEQGEGYVIGKRAKKTADEAFFMEGGCYTTCDNHEHPHFYLALTKAKVRPKKNVIFGPAYLVIEDLPIPFIGIPFGFFPFTDKYSSGVLMPSPGDDMERGFNLRDGGYYFAINDNIDFALRSEIYTNGSWGLNGQSSYLKRYKYSGNVNAGYLVTVRGDKGLPDYSVSKDLRLNWSHSQDSRANMFRTFTASVDFSTSSYNRNQIDAQYDMNQYTQGTKGSSISLTQRFPNSPINLSATMNINQRTQDSAISMTLPNLMASMSRITPFKRKEAVGKERWYEKIQMSYSGEVRNSIDTKENLLFKSNLMTDWKHGMRHSIPVSATFNVLDYVNITPSVNYTERWYTEKVKQGWSKKSNSFVNTDTITGFNRVYDFSASLGVQTKLYGFFKPLFFKKADIRHVLTPSVSYSFTPDFSDPRFGYYEKIKYYDANGNLQEHVYSLYQSGMFGSPGRGKSGSVNFDFQNNVEMKVQTIDTIKKISLIDNLGIGFSYNMMADSLKWSDISTNIRFKLSKTLTVNLTATFDPYLYSERGQRIDQLRIQNGKGIGRLRRTGYSFSHSINQDTFKKWFGKEDETKDKKPNGDNEGDENGEMINENQNEATEGTRKSRFSNKQDDGDYDTDGYLKNELQWSVSANYSFSYGYADFNQEKREYNRKLTHNLGFSGMLQPTKNWSFNCSSAWDFEVNKITYMSCNFTRNLHCWSLSGSFSPIGYKSYFVTLRANSSMLQDLKYEKRQRSTQYDPQWD